MNNNYKASGLFKNGHFNTVYSHFLCKAKQLSFTRERLALPEGVSLFLDWMKDDNERLVIFCHGLESSSNARYIQTMGAHFSASAYDVLAWNLRNCAEGEPFEKNAHYHSGISEDLDSVVEHVLATCQYQQIVLVGFSMGGNLMLKYLGEKGGELPCVIKRAMAVSTPVDLLSCSYVLLKMPNRVYGNNFLKTILHKIRTQRDDVAELGLDVERILQSKNLREFDDAFTAPFHGFDSEDHYYTSCSALPLLPHITIPTLILSALDDPMLTPECYPEASLIGNPLVQTVYTRHGGHVGFYTPSDEGIGWMEQQALRFLAETDISANKQIKTNNNKNNNK